MKDNFSIRQIAAPFVIFLLLLSGCIPVSRSPSPRLYVLQSIKEAREVALADAAGLSGAIVGIGPIALPEYFNRPQIVTNNNNDMVGFAQFDRWAEPLDTEMQRVIAQNLSVLLPEVNTETFPWNSAIPIKYQVLMNVIQLDCRLDGEVVFLTQWSVLDAQEKKMVLTKRSEYRKAVAKPDYSSLVQAINVICESMSREIAQTLIGLEKQSPAPAGQ